MNAIFYAQPDNKLAVIIPATDELTIEEIAAKDVPPGAAFKIVEALDLDDEFFDAYDFDAEAGAVVNIARAKEIQLNKFRVARAPKLAALDIEYMKAMEEMATMNMQTIAHAKQQLRDVTKIALPDDLAGIKATWPAVLN